MRAPTLDILVKLMKPTGRAWLLMAAAVSFFVAILHVVIVLIGPSAYSFFGGQRLARLAESGSSSPVIQTLSLAAVHALFGSYALAGAGIIRRLPLLTVALFAIGGMYAFRGLSAIEQALQLLRDPDSLPFRVLLYSLVSFATGCAYIVGSVKRWGWLRDEGEIEA
ncbi:MAG: hypothetical protein ACHBMF_01770 [Chromatiales bacterium]